ncbi:TetR/AcrR family transcriptional regulator [Pseudonocardia sp. NPDC049154]|uniref:TetR/AcrR family transcriptional regulator n=1 Tax=Pseudonocardia sp. NPDC049154 TaxID=3155501 RepID=UPI0033F3FB8D
MADPVNRRRYRSALRADQARETRRRILAAAESLFVVRGYAGTTVAAVAEAAGVAPDTVYTVLGGKRGLLDGVIAHESEDPDDPVQADQRRRRDELGALPDPVERLRGLVALSCETLARTSPVHLVIRGAADGHPFAAELRARMLRRRLDIQRRHLATHLGGALRDGLGAEEAARRYSALLSPELYHLLTTECGWTAAQYEGWVVDLLQHDLLGPRPTARADPGPP